MAVPVIDFSAYPRPPPRSSAIEAAARRCDEERAARERERAEKTEGESVASTAVNQPTTTDGEKEPDKGMGRKSGNGGLRLESIRMRFGRKD